MELVALVPSNGGAVNTLANTPWYEHNEYAQGEVLVNSQENAKSFSK